MLVLTDRTLWLFVLYVQLCVCLKSKSKSVCVKIIEEPSEDWSAVIYSQDAAFIFPNIITGVCKITLGECIFLLMLISCAVQGKLSFSFMSFCMTEISGMWKELRKTCAEWSRVVLLWAGSYMEAKPACTSSLIFSSTSRPEGGN